MIWTLSVNAYRRSGRLRWHAETPTHPSLNIWLSVKVSADLLWWTLVWCEKCGSSLCPESADRRISRSSRYSKPKSRRQDFVLGLTLGCSILPFSFFLFLFRFLYVSRYVLVSRTLFVGNEVGISCSRYLSKNESSDELKAFPLFERRVVLAILAK